MNGGLGSELFIQARRRALSVSLVTVMLLITVFSAYRFLTSSSDTREAQRNAELSAAQLTAAMGSPVTTAATYVEPRYVFRSEFAYDAAGAALGIALVFLVGGAVLAGGDWRSRAVRITWAPWRRRGLAALTRVLIWTAISTAGAFLALSLLSCLLAVTAVTRGSLTGLEPVTVLLVLGRGTLLAAAGGMAGAGLGTVVRSDVVVVVVLLAYVLLIETLWPVLAPNGRWASPGTKLLAWVISPDVAPRPGTICDVPRCAQTVTAGWGSWTGYALGAVVAAALLLIAYLSARRDDWR